jgi:hypothetical protein
VEPEDHDRWYAVRSLFRSEPSPDLHPPGLGDGESAFEERITLWRAPSFEEALDEAEKEAEEYAEFAGASYLSDFGQVYHLADAPPREGAEVFSSIRFSPLAPGPYVDRFFSTGQERQQ